MNDKREFDWTAVGGIDTSAYSGVESDVRYGTMHGCTVLPVVSAITSQSTDKILNIQSTNPDIFRESLEITLNLNSKVLKSAMLHNQKLVIELYKFLNSNTHIFYILDPVFKSTSGTWLIDKAGINVIKEYLITRADLIVPNRFELELLTGIKISSKNNFIKAGLIIAEKTKGKKVLLKGGHFNTESNIITDIFIENGKIYEFTHSREEGVWRGRGTCLSASISSLICKGLSPIEAIEKAIEFCSNKNFFYRIK